MFRSRSKVRPLSLGLTVFVTALLLPLALPLTAVANHGTRTLDVTPETARVEVGEAATLTATLSSEVTVASGTVNIDFENEEGFNDTDATSRTSPDLTCSIAAGESSCTVTYTGTNAGADLWRAWIDHDGLDSSDESDTSEARDEARRAGDGGPGPCSTRRTEPDCTDVVRVNYVSGGGEALDCDDPTGPDTENEPIRAGGGAASNATYTCTVTDELGNPTNDADPVTSGVQPIVVNAEVINGVNDPDEADGASLESPDYTCTAGEPDGQAAGTCQITVTQNENEMGTAQICFWVGDTATGQSACQSEPVAENQLADGSDSGNDLADAVNATWENPRAAGLDVEREDPRGPLGEAHEVTATVYDQFGEPFVGVTSVNFEFFKGSPSDSDGNTPGDPDLSCTTTSSTVPESSTCTSTFTQSETPGTDLICGWLAPEVKTVFLIGTNNNGTCNGEGLVDEDDTAGEADAPVPAGDGIDVVRKSWQSPTTATTLDCSPETQTHSISTSTTIVCKATDDAGEAVGGAEVDIESTGVNDPDNGYFPEAPEFSCVTGATGTCTVKHGSGGVGKTGEAGLTEYRAWLDADNWNGTTEADAAETAGSDATTADGNNTDVVQRRFTKPSGGCTLRGTEGNDRLIGTPGRDVICGLGGNDNIQGLSGRDKIAGGEGADQIKGGSGGDSITAGSGKDNVAGGKGDDKINGGAGKDKCSGGPGTDSVTNCE